MATPRFPLSRLHRMLGRQPRMAVATLFGIAAGVLAPASSLLVHVLIGWNAGAVLFIALALVMMARAEPKEIRGRAGDEDEGRFTVLTLVIAAAVMILIAIVLEIVAARELQGLARVWGLALTFLTIIASWAFVHIVFAIYYAHEFHAEAKGGKGARRGLGFPGGQVPDYWDFLYFSFTVGMTAQTSDVAVQSRTMRKLVMVHGILAFVFTTAVIALTVNLGAQLVS